jgi:hypothetical protein
MQTTRKGIETAPGPSEWFTGAVFHDSPRLGRGRRRRQPCDLGDQVTDKEYVAAPPIDHRSRWTQD